MDDEAARWQGWWLSDALVHPDAPAGGSGPGSARLPGPLTPPAYRWTTPHPDAPAVRLHGLQRVPPLGAGRKSAAATTRLKDLNESFETLSDNLRRALPDPSLRAVYGLYVDQQKIKNRHARGVGEGAPDGNKHAQRLFELVSWIDPPFFQTLSTQGTASSPGQAQSRFSGFEALAERVFKAAEQRLAEQWDEASRAGTQQQNALLHEWTRRIEFPLFGRPSGTGEESTPAERRVPRSAPEPDPEKTWVEVQVLDEQGNVLSNIAYDVTLPDGSHRTGRLNDYGKLKFTNIDPGQCVITFPELDGREWKSM